MSTSEPGAQSATARRSAEAELRGLIDKHAPAQEASIGAARKWLRKRLPAAHELIYEYRDWIVISFTPNGKGYDGVLAIRADAKGVDLYFNRGKELPDPEKLLRGSATLVRFIHLEGASTLARPEVVRLADEAIARNPLPFEGTGRGSVVIHQVAKKKDGKSLAAAASRKKKSRKPG